MRTMAKHAASSLLGAKLSQDLVSTKELESFHSVSTFMLHDMKNFVSMLSLVVDNMDRNFNNPDFRRDALASISQTVEKMQRLMERLAILSKGPELCDAPVDLNELVRETLVELRNSIQSKIIENAKGKKAGDFFTFGFDDERTIKNDKNEDEKIKEHFDYKAQINEIKKIILPELNEELIKKVTKDKVSNEEDLKKEIRKDIQYYYDQKEEEILRGKLMNTIIKNNDFTPPTTMVNNIVEHFVKNEEEYSKKQRIPTPSHEEMEERFTLTAQNDVKWYLLKTEIIKKENITIADDELKELAEKEAEDAEQAPESAL